MHPRPSAIQRENHDTGTQEEHHHLTAQYGQQHYNGDSSPAYSQPDEYSGTSVSGSEWSLSSTPTGQSGIWMNDEDTSGLEDSVATLVSYCDSSKEPSHAIKIPLKGSSPLQEMPEGELTRFTRRDVEAHPLQNCSSILSRISPQMICLL